MEVAYKASNFNREPIKIESGQLILFRYDIAIRFGREDLPTPADKK
jgi:hypothetical protein